MCAQKTEAERPSQGVQTFVVEDEPQWGPGHIARVVRTAYQRVPDRNARIKRTEASCVKLKRQVWTSLLWLMTALWVQQVNVLSDRGKPLPLTIFYPEVPRNGFMRFGLRLFIGNKLCQGCARKTGYSTGIAFAPEAAVKSRNG